MSHLSVNGFPPSTAFGCRSSAVVHAQHHSPSLREHAMPQSNLSAPVSLSIGIIVLEIHNFLANKNTIPR